MEKTSMFRRIPTIFCGTAAFVAIAAATATVGAAPAPQVIRMTVKKFEYSVKEIHAKKGVPVTIEITSEDRLHGFSIPDFGVRGDVKKGKTTKIAFTPDKTGTFDYLCDIFCGDGHGDVTGKLIVEE
jgi:cytochrome c oxidase subunit II